MKIIDIGICIDNVDPKGVGRIRCVRYSEYVSAKEGAYEYNKWSEIDPFIAIPFLPLNINFIPEKGQAVKIINYNTTNEVVNQEYIAGPFTNIHNFNQQVFSSQIENTTYGTLLKSKPKIIDENGNFFEKKSENFYGKYIDYTIYGKNGSDIIFTKDGLHLRAGKMESSSPNNLKDNLFPKLSNFFSSIQLKRFNNYYTLSDDTTSTTEVEKSLINYVIEYEITTLTSPSQINFYVYKILNNKDIYFTDKFTNTTEINKNDVKLINNENDSTSPSKTYDLENVELAPIFLRDILFKLHNNGLTEFFNNNIDFSLTPFYFRLTKKFLNIIPTNDTQTILKNKIINSIFLNKIGPNNGLIWSKYIISPPIKTNNNVQYILKKDPIKTQQTFGSITADSIYFLSYDANKTNKSIDFNVLDKYEYSQSNYLKDIDPNTFSMVRGENLIEVLKSMIDVLFSHRHNLTKPMVKGGDDYEKLISLITNLENDLLNKKIRIN